MNLKLLCSALVLGSLQALGSGPSVTPGPSIEVSFTCEDGSPMTNGHWGLTFISQDKTRHYVKDHASLMNFFIQPGKLIVLTPQLQSLVLGTFSTPKDCMTDKHGSLSRANPLHLAKDLYVEETSYKAVTHCQYDPVFDAYFRWDRLTFTVSNSSKQEVYSYVETIPQFFINPSPEECSISKN